MTNYRQGKLSKENVRGRFLLVDSGLKHERVTEQHAVLLQVIFAEVDGGRDEQWQSAGGARLLGVRRLRLCLDHSLLAWHHQCTSLDWQLRRHIAATAVLRRPAHNPHTHMVQSTHSDTVQAARCMPAPVLSQSLSSCMAPSLLQHHLATASPTTHRCYCHPLSAYVHIHMYSTGRRCGTVTAKLLYVKLGYY